MNIFYQFAIFVVGLIVLWRAGFFAVKSAIQVSLVFGLKSFTLGFFIFALSTGLPEIIATIVSSIQQVPELAAGDLLGASFVNISLVLGVTLILARVIRIDDMLKKQLFRTILLLIFIYTGLLTLPETNWIIGILLILIYFSSMLWFNSGIPQEEVSQELKEMNSQIEELKKKLFLPLKVHVLLKLFGSLTFLTFGAWITVQSASNIASFLNINLSIFGATLVAIGTCLPELALEIQAVRQKEYGLALGDIFGSSLVNMSLILGFLISINPKISMSFIGIILPFFLIASGTIFWCLKKKNFSAQEGYFLLGLFVLFLIAAFSFELIIGPLS